MFTVTSLPLAVALCVITMLCWGSWANTQKLSGRVWPFQLFYWDYALGVLLLSLLSAFTLGSTGGSGRAFLADLGQASTGAIVSALIGGVIFNLSNILLVAAIDIAGMAVAFPVGVGLALILGVISSYLTQPSGQPAILAAGVLMIAVAIVLDALAYRRLALSSARTPRLGIILSVTAGVLMGFFYRFVVAAMVDGHDTPAQNAGRMGPYAAIVLFSLGLFLSNFVWNSLVMIRPFSGKPVAFSAYFQGGARQHLVGILGGMIWNLGMSLSILASGAAGPAVSYGLGQGATMVAAIWGVFVWKEFRGAPSGTGTLLALMFVCYLAGLTLIIASH
jgi:glucose uptake protein